MLGDPDVAVVDAHHIVERDPHRNPAPDERGRDAVAVAADLEVAVPADLPTLPVGGVVALGRERPQRGSLPREPLGDHLVDGAVHARVGFLPQPVLRLCVSSEGWCVQWE